MVMLASVGVEPSTCQHLISFHLDNHKIDQIDAMEAQDTLADMRKVFETEFWTDTSEDEGIGSDDSMDNVKNHTGTVIISEKSITSEKCAVNRHEQVSSLPTKNLIKRSRSLVAINQFGSRLMQQISRQSYEWDFSGAFGNSRIDKVL